MQAAASVTFCITAGQTGVKASADFATAAASASLLNMTDAKALMSSCTWCVGQQVCRRGITTLLQN